MNNSSSECFQEYDEELYKVSRLSSHHSPATIVFPQSLMFWISGVATVVTSGLGIVGNILSLVVLCRKVQSECQRLCCFICICISDTQILLKLMNIFYAFCDMKYVFLDIFNKFNKICDMQNRQHLNRMWCEGLVSNMKSL